MYMTSDVFISIEDTKRPSYFERSMRVLDHQTTRWRHDSALQTRSWLSFICSLMKASRCSLRLHDPGRLKKEQAGEIARACLTPMFLLLFVAHCVCVNISGSDFIAFPPLYRISGIQPVTTEGVRMRNSARSYAQTSKRFYCEVKDNSNIASLVPATTVRMNPAVSMPMFSLQVRPSA